MATKRTKSKSLVATLVTENRAPCVFCERLADDEVIYGKLYAIGDIQCHYFCVLLSCCLIQKGKDQEGLFGFMYADILAEVERSKKHRCSFCGKGGATLGCSVSQCRKQFHLPCGRERNAVSLFYGNYKSFCQLHAPKQKIPDHIMANVRVRMRQAKSNVQRPPQKLSCLKELYESPTKDATSQDPTAESVCVICYSPVDGLPTTGTFWPPCCARDAWLHRHCLQRMALSAGMHYLKCPLCNDKENFYDAVVTQGYYVPDRDAAWELEQNAFADIYERPLVCSADECKCPNGNNYDAETGEWDIKLCILCGTSGSHLGCLQDAGPRFVCATCKPAAPADLAALAARVERVILAEQAQAAQNERKGPVMPSRMSLRRTKQGFNAPSTSRTRLVKTESNDQAQKTATESSRLELNLKTPKRPTKPQNSTEKPIFEPSVLKDIENKLLSPLKLVEEGLHERIRCLGVREIEIDSNKVIERVREKFKKPRPLCVKKKIVKNILENLLENIVKKNNPEIKEAVKEWTSPKKSLDDSQSIEKPSQENKSPVKKFTPQKVTRSGKQRSKISPLSLKRRTPVKIKISAKDNSDKSLEKITENERKEINGEVLLKEDTTPSKEGITSNNTSTPAKKDSKSKNTEKEDTLKEINVQKDGIPDDESSRSTFELPSEFIAYCNSDDSLPLFETPKKLKTVEIEKDSSLEICENNEVVNINHIKIERNAEKSEFLKNLNLRSPVKTKKCALKFSAKDKETLEKANLDIDMESFKNYYLNEVGKDVKCEFGHNHKVAEQKTDTVRSSTKLRTAIDFALEASKRKDSDKNLKRKSSIQEELPGKKKKSPATEVVKKNNRSEKHKTQSSKIRLAYDSKKKQKRDALKKKKLCQQTQNEKEDSTSLQVVCSNTGTEDNIKTLNLTIESPPERKTKASKKMKRKKVMKNNIQVKIRFKEQQLRLKITKSQGKKSKNKGKKNKVLNQYVLKYYSSDNKSKNAANSLIAKPEQPVTPIRRKHVKLEKSPDNLVQTSIQSFFKVKPPSQQNTLLNKSCSVGLYSPRKYK